MTTNTKGGVSISTINGLAPGQTVFDKKCPGYFVRKRSSGRVYYGFKYHFSGQQRIATIGEHGIAGLTEAKARGEAEKMRGLVRSHVDPQSSRDRLREVPRVKDAFAQFLADKARLSDRTREGYEHQFRNYIEPRFGSLKISAIEASSIATWHASMRDRRTTANRCAALLSSLMSWAERRGYRQQKTNPCFGLERFEEREIERFLTRDEVGSIFRAMAELEEAGRLSPYFRVGICLLLLTGARRGEVFNCFSTWVDVHHGVIRLPTSKTGKKTVVLSLPAIALIESLPKFPENPYLLPGEKAGRPISGFSKTWSRILNHSGVTNCRLHDIRHSFASFAAADGVALLVIGKALGHSQTATTERYSHIGTDPVRDAAESVASILQMPGNRQIGRTG